MLDTLTSALTIDNVPQELNYPLQPSWTKGLVTVSVGITFSESGPWTIRNDSVLVQLTP
jgi:hypothetical protein